MGCTQSKTHSKLYPVADEPIFTNYVHYLGETVGKWLLVLYSPEERRFRTLQLDAETLHPACESVVIRGVLYCSGGVGRNKSGLALPDLRSVSFLLKRNHVTTLAQMSRGRCKHGISEISSTSLCVVGGLIREAEILSGCEIYDVLTNTWTPAGELNYPRSSAAVCCFNSKYVYVFGGVTRADSATADTNVIECMDTQQPVRKWVVITCMDDCCHVNTSKMWCTQVDERNILVFGTDKTTIFDTYSRKMEKVTDQGQRYAPDKRVDIRRHEDEINMILDAGGNVGIYSISTQKWRVQPHIVLGL